MDDEYFDELPPRERFTGGKVQVRLPKELWDWVQGGNGYRLSTPSEYIRLALWEHREIKLAERAEKARKKALVEARKAAEAGEAR